MLESMSFAKVLGYEANYLTLSARLPQMQTSWKLRVAGGIFVWLPIPGSSKYVKHLPFGRFVW